MISTPPTAPVNVGRFDPAQVFPPGDPLTVPLFRLMIATDDARCAGTLFLMTNQQVDQTTGIQQTLLGGQLWYLFRLLCLHLKEAHNALGTLDSRVAKRRLGEFLRERPAATEAMDRFRSGFGADSFITRVRDSMVSHYKHGDIERVYQRHLAEGKVEGTVVACEVGVLSRFTITDLLALHVVDEAVTSGGPGADAEFAKQAEKVTELLVDLSTFVGHLVAALLKEHGVEGTRETIEVPGRTGCGGAAAGGRTAGLDRRKTLGIPERGEQAESA